MATAAELHPPLPWRRLGGCLGMSLALHLAPFLLLGTAWLRPAPQTPMALLEARLLPPPQAALSPPAERLLKDTMNDAPTPVPPQVAVVPALRPAPSAAFPSRPVPADAARQRAAERKLAQHVFYPPEAVAAGIEGEVRLLLTLDGDGRLLDAVIASSSGHAVLDSAALDAAWAMRRLPGMERRELILPVVFRLE